MSLASSQRNIDDYIKSLDKKMKHSKQVFENCLPPLKSAWDNVLFKARKRDPDSCPICLMDIHLPDTIGQKLTKKIFLTSCSHSIHQQCMESFEQFINVKKCPICREEYDKKLIG
jgi:rubrerythrin